MTSEYNFSVNPQYRDLGCPAQCGANNEYSLLDDYSKFEYPKASLLAFKLNQKEILQTLQTESNKLDQGSNKTQENPNKVPTQFFYRYR